MMFQFYRDDTAGWRAHAGRMSDQDAPDWYLQEWAKLRGYKQADMARALGMLKNTAYLVWHGHQPYRRDTLNAAARWLEIEPFELLMPPTEALALRRLRETAFQIAAEESGREFVGATAERKR